MENTVGMHHHTQPPMHFSEYKNDIKIGVLKLPFSQYTWFAELGSEWLHREGCTVKGCHFAGWVPEAWVKVSRTRKHFLPNTKSKGFPNLYTMRYGNGVGFGAKQYGFDNKDYKDSVELDSENNLAKCSSGGFPVRFFGLGK